MSYPWQPADHGHDIGLCRRSLRGFRGFSCAAFRHNLSAFFNLRLRIRRNIAVAELPNSTRWPTLEHTMRQRECLSAGSYSKARDVLLAGCKRLCGACIRAPSSIGVMEDDMKIASKAARVFLLLGLASIPAMGQTDDMLRRIQPFVMAVNEGLDEIDSQLAGIEQRASIVPGDERVGSLMDDVAKASSEALRSLIDATGDADKTRIAESFPQAFAEFEKMGQSFRARAEKIAERVLTIQQGIIEGRIIIALDVFDQSTARERVEFMKMLTPKAQDMYRKMSPAKFSGLDFHLQKLGMMLNKAVKDACIPDANAFLAAVCVITCQTSPSSCVACVAAATAAGGTATYLYFKNGYESCLRNCCGCSWRRFWCCGCKVGCVLAWAAFIA
jgi:hypothetical protein